MTARLDRTPRVQLRDDLAARCLDHLLANAMRAGAGYYYADLASRSYALADAMLRARSVAPIPMPAEASKPRHPLHCSFCSKHQDDVRKLIAGPGTILICDECVALCADIIREETKADEPAEAGVA